MKSVSLSGHFAQYRLRHRRLAVLTMLATLALSIPAAAQTWVGPFNDWNTASNWSPAAVPNSNVAVASFTGNAPTNPNISANVSAASLVFNNPTGSYSLTSNSGVSLNSVTSITVGAGVTGVETINLAFISAGSLILPSGNNDLTITNNSTATGTTLVIGPSTVIGANGNGGVVVTGAGTTEISGSFTAGPVNAVTGGLIKQGSGTLILSRLIPNTYGGGTTVIGGTLIAHNSIPTGGDVTVASGAQFNIGSAGNSAGTAIGTLALNGTGSFRVTGGSGDYYLNQLVMYGGIVDFTGTNGFGLHLRNTGAAITTNGSSTTASWGGDMSRIQNDTAGPLTITVNQGATPSGIDLDAGTILTGVGYTKSGLGTMRLTNPANTANFNVTQGKLRVDDVAALGSGTVTLSGGGGSLVYGGPTAATTKSFTLANTGIIQVLSNGANLTLNGAINQSIGGESLFLFGPAAQGVSSTLTLGATNSYSGFTGINFNAVVAVPTLANGGVPSPIGFSSNSPSSLLLGESDFRGTLLLTGTDPSYSTDRGATLGGDVNSYTISGAGGAIGVENAGTTLTMSGQLTGGTLIKTGAGVLRLGAPMNNYTGGTYVEGGTLTVAIPGAVIPTNSDVTVSIGATLQIGFNALGNQTAPLHRLTLNGGTLRIPAGTPSYYMNQLSTGTSGGTFDLTGSTGTVVFTGTGTGATINGNTNWIGGSNTHIRNESADGTKLTISPNVTLTCQVALDNSFQIVGGGTLYMTTPANSAFARYTVSQGRLRVDDLSVNGPVGIGESVLGTVRFGFLTLDGGALQYSGATASSPMPIVFSTAGASVEVSNAATSLTVTGTIASNDGSLTGPLTKTGPGVLVLNNVANTYDGGIVISGGRLEVSGDALLGRAAITINPLGALRYTASTATGRSFTLLGGALEAPAGVTLTMNGAAVGGGLLRGAGTFALSGGTALVGAATSTSTMVNQTGPAAVTNFTSGGAFTIGAGQTLSWNGGANTSSGRLVVNGMANVGDFVSDGQLNIPVGGVLNNTGSPLVLGGGSRTFVGTAASPGGALNLGGQALELNGGLLVNNGIVSGTVNVNYGSLAKGTGVYGVVNVNQGGVYAPGNSPGISTAAAVTFDNTFVTSGAPTLAIELSGTAPGTQYDQLHVTGHLSLGGALTVSLLNSFAPVAGQAFDILDWGSLSGTFASLNLPTLSGLTWNTGQLYATGVLSVGLSGDYNNNGTVDAADYVVWRKGLGTTYTQTDYDVWRGHFGATTGAGGSSEGAPSRHGVVPEPRDMAFAPLGAIAALVSRCRRRESSPYQASRPH